MYQVVIGLEVHVQLLTSTKLFCGCSTKFGLPPNSATCPVCLGLPGALPVMNCRAFELGVRAALALNCTIAPKTRWDRKNYFYPDLPKGYQISQYDLPFSSHGYLEVDAGQGPRKIGIQRVHLEEDAGKLIHEESRSLVDLNRAGTPLVEIVSRPELTSAAEAKAYLEQIRLMMRDLGVSDCEMQEGSLRCDANINLHVDGAATPIVEIKNLNSFRAVERALNYEAQRQLDEFGRTGQKLGDVPKATAGWDDVRGVTVVQRRKEEAEDYRYFPEPDLVQVVVDPQWLESMRSRIGEIPAVRGERLKRQYGLSGYDADVLNRQGRAFVKFFEDAALHSSDAKSAANWMINQVQQALHERNLAIDRFPISPERLGQMIRKVRDDGLNTQRSREVFARMVETGQDVQEAITSLGFQSVTDEGAIREIVTRALAANAKAVADYRKGKVKALDAIKGMVMRETRGLAKTELVQKIVLEEIVNVP